MKVRLAVSALLVAVASIGLIAPAAEAKSSTLRVMTRNLYLGTDLIPIAVAPNRSAFEQAATRGYDNVKATDFRARARRIAAEIKRTRPDVIGLQEVALWRTGPKDGVSSNERTVRYDWLRILNRALRRAGLRYRSSRRLTQREFDFSGPTSGNFDVRLTMRDAILVRRRKGLRVRRARHRNFRTSVKIPVPGIGRTVDVTRGWVYADMRLGRKRFRALDTHLEAYGNAPRLAQAQELIARGGPARSRRPVILIGDLNSDPNGDPNGEGDPAPYNAITGFRFRDSWRRAHPNRKGYACCTKHKGADGLPDLLDPPPFPADHRIDHILFKGRGRLSVRGARRVGLDPGNRTASGLWPSDHGGQVTRFRIR